MTDDTNTEYAINRQSIMLSAMRYNMIALDLIPRSPTRAASKLKGGARLGF